MFRFKRRNSGMFYLLFPEASLRVMTTAAVVFSCLLTFAALGCLKDKLPKDGGREFAVNGAKSVGKPRGAGLLLIFAFVITALLFLPGSMELLIYLILAVVEMLSGYFDDASDKPWGRLVKGLLDFGVALVCAITWLANNPSTFRIAISGAEVAIPRPVYACLIIVLIWASINVVNCSDGVDGLCASLSAVTLFSVFLIQLQRGSGQHLQPSQPDPHRRDPCLSVVQLVPEHPAHGRRRFPRHRIPDRAGFPEARVSAAVHSAHHNHDSGRRPRPREDHTHQSHAPQPAQEPAHTDPRPFPQKQRLVGHTGRGALHNYPGTDRTRCRLRILLIS
jgi:hypothetical protein